MANEDDSHPIAALIRRVKNTSDDSPPWTGIAFTMPVDSDKLADELRRAYPEYSTLRERKHMAAIDFLKNELSLIHQETSESAASKEYEVAPSQDFDPFPYDPEVRGWRGSVSSSPYLVSTNQDALPLKHDLLRSGAQGTNAATKVTGSAQELVFSVSDGRPMQLKTKRRMTKEEKVVYRKTRKRGACSRCRRQKEKVCTLQRSHHWH